MSQAANFNVAWASDDKQKERLFCNGFACLLTPMLLEACGIATPTSCSQPCLHAHLFCVLSHGFSRKRESAVNLLIKGFDSPSLVLSKLCVLKTFKVAYNLQFDENIIYGKFCFSFHGGPLPGIQSGGVKLEKGQDKKGWGEARQSISQSVSLLFIKLYGTKCSTVINYAEVESLQLQM